MKDTEVVRMKKPSLLGDDPVAFVRDSLLQGWEGQVVLLEYTGQHAKMFYDDRVELETTLAKMVPSLRVFKYDLEPFDGCGEGPVWDWVSWDAECIEGDALFIVVDNILRRSWRISDSWLAFLRGIKSRRGVESTVRFLSMLPPHFYVQDSLGGLVFDVVEWNGGPGETRPLKWFPKDMTPECRKLMTLVAAAPVVDPLIVRMVRQMFLPGCGVWVEHELLVEQSRLWEKREYDGALLQKRYREKALEDLCRDYKDLLPELWGVMQARSLTLPPGLRNEERIVMGILLGNDGLRDYGLETLLEWDTPSNRPRLRRYLQRMWPSLLAPIEGVPQVTRLKGIAFGDGTEAV